MLIPQALYFDVRTRSLNSVVFVVMQTVGALGITPLLDSQRIGSRRTRGFVSITIMGAFTIATWIGLLVWLDRNLLDPSEPPLWGWNNDSFGGFFALTLLLGINMVVVSIINAAKTRHAADNCSIKLSSSGLLER